MFFEHLELTIKEEVFLLLNNFPSSIAVFDKIEAEALQMADDITNAIARQFPRKFK